MGFYSQVQITAEAGSFRMFDEVLKKHELKYKLTGTEENKVIKIDWIKWYPDFDSVKEVEDLQKKLCTDEFDGKEGYGFKTMILNEDDSHEEYSNTRGDTVFCDLCFQSYIDNPYDV